MYGNPNPHSHSLHYLHVLFFVFCDPLKPVKAFFMFLGVDHPLGYGQPPVATLSSHQLPIALPLWAEPHGPLLAML